MVEWTARKDGESLRQYRERYFSALEASARIVGRVEFDYLYAPVIRAYGINSPAFVDTKSHRIVVCDDVPDGDFIGFMLYHEIWEDYVVNKPGFNLRLYEQFDRTLPVDKMIRPAHRLATFKEFSFAKSKGKLEEYCGWWANFYEKDAQSVRGMHDDVVARIGRNYRASTVEETRARMLGFIDSNAQLRRRIGEKVRLSDCG